MTHIKIYSVVNKIFNRTCLNRYAAVHGRICSTHFSTSGHGLQNKKKIDLSEFPVENIRNFSIIAHVDHGKSTLADRLLEITGTISKDTQNKQVLDKLQVERERGITVKAQTASLIYTYNNTKYLLNLIDTPGHVDFNYEVSRSMAACQGVVLLIDANQGIQAQTVANFYLAFEHELEIIPVMNKIDLKVAKPDEVEQQIKNIFDFKAEEIMRVSAKLGTGVEDVLKAVIDRIPPPVSDLDKPAKALLFDSWFDRYRGAVCSIAVIDGAFNKGDRIQSAHSKKNYEVQEIGIMYPDEVSCETLYAGQVGYLYGHLKTTEEARIGDTFYLEKAPVEPLPGFKPATPMVFAGFFPTDQSEYPLLKKALEKLRLNDSSVQVNPDSSSALGQGWRLGFLGLLHLDVFMQRLEQEYNAHVVVTSPNIPYKVKIHGAQNIKHYGGEEVTILNPCLLPEENKITEYQEPMVMSTIISPDDYTTSIVTLCMERRGEQVDQTYIDNKRIMYKVIFPLGEILIDFFDELKSLTSGFASFDYEDYGYRITNLVKIDFYLNGNKVDELTQISHVSKAKQFAKKIAVKLKETIPQQLFVIAIQAKIGVRVIAREDIRAIRKDVLAKCYGGDITRKNKLLKKQAAGKQKLRKIGNIDVPKDTFIKVLKK